MQHLSKTHVLPKFTCFFYTHFNKNEHQNQLIPKFIKASLLGIKAEKYLNTHLRGRLDSLLVSNPLGFTMFKFATAYFFTKSHTISSFVQLVNLGKAQ